MYRSLISTVTLRCFKFLSGRSKEHTRQPYHTHMLSIRGNWTLSYMAQRAKREGEVSEGEELIVHKQPKCLLNLEDNWGLLAKAIIALEIMDPAESGKEENNSKVKPK